MDTQVNKSMEPDRRIVEHGSALARKPVLRDVFVDIHHKLRALDEKWFGETPGDRIELGSGVCPMRDVYPDTLPTDVVPAPHLDAVIDGQDLQRPLGSVRTLFLQNAFHHIPDPEAFFQSASKALAVGGGIIMLEPHWGPVASLIYPRLFATEGFDKRQKGWRQEMSSAMNGANQALSYVVLKRDYELFRQRFNEFEVVDRGVSTTYLRYVASGGLNFPQLLNNFGFKILKGVEALASPIASFAGLHQWLVIKKHA